MTIQSFEFKAVGVSGSNDSRQRRYVVQQTGGSDAFPNEIEVYDAAYNPDNTPPEWDGLRRTDVNVNLQRDAEPEYYFVEVNYGRDEREREDQSGSPSETTDKTFNVSVQTLRVKTALNQRGFENVNDNPSSPVTAGAGSYIGPGSPINVKNTRDGGVTTEGVDINIPQASFSENYLIGPEFVNDAYRNLLLASVGKVNDRVWSGQPKGSVLLIGVQATWKRLTPSRVSFEYAISPPETDITFEYAGNKIIIPAKEGWEYAWLQNRIGSTAFGLGEVPFRAYVSQVYKYTDFTQLTPSRGVLFTEGGNQFWQENGSGLRFELAT